MSWITESFSFMPSVILLLWIRQSIWNTANEAFHIYILCVILCIDPCLIRLLFNKIQFNLCWFHIVYSHIMTMYVFCNMIEVKRERFRHLISQFEVHLLSYAGSNRHRCHSTWLRAAYFHSITAKSLKWTHGPTWIMRSKVLQGYLIIWSYPCCLSWNL